MIRSVASYELNQLPVLTGRLVTTVDSDYDELRTTTFDVSKHPAAIVRVADAADVAAMIGHVRQHRIEFAVRSGGHSVAGHSATEGGIVLDLRELKSVDVDLVARTVWAGAGLTAGELTVALQPYRLIVGFGDTGSVGLGGITLGGGIGYLSRKHGLSIDSLLAAEIVLATGEMVIANETHHPDLFWALRGGGGNFGIVTRLKFQLHVLPEFTGGRLVLPATSETIAGFVRAADAAPDELSTIATIMPASSMRSLPAEAMGKPLIIAMMAFAGPAEAANRALSPFRALADPLIDLVEPRPYAVMLEPRSSGHHPTVASQSFFLDRICAVEADTIVDFVDRLGRRIGVVQLRVLGGAIARVSVDATAYGHRNRRILAAVAAFYEGEKSRSVAQMWVDDLAVALGRSGGSYINFLAGSDVNDIEAAYPGPIWPRLRQVKRAYDPENLFRLNHNIPPA